MRNARLATLVASLLCASSLAHAQGESAVNDPFASRGSAIPPVLRFVQSQDVELVALGEVGGIKGYLARSANGSHQVVYPTDDEHVVAGVLLRSGGDNVTSRQIGEMVTRFSQAATLDGHDALPTPDLGEENLAAGPIVEWFRSKGLTITDITMDEGGVDAVLVETPATEDSPSKAQVYYVLPDAPEYAIAGMMLRNGGMNVTGLQIADLRQRINLEKATVESGASTISPTVNKPVAPAVAFPEPTATEPAAVEGAVPVEPSAASSFLLPDDIGQSVADAMTTSRYFTVGNASAPQIFMVADPNCPFCHEAWRQLKPRVDAGEIALNIVMIAGLSGSDVKARSIVARIDGGGATQAWLSGEGSVSNVAVQDGPLPGSEAWMNAGSVLESNMGIMRRFGIGQTPFLAYVGADGKSYATTGVPSRFEDFLGAKG